MSRSRYCRFWYLVTVFSLVHRGLFFQGVHICVPANSGEHSMVIFIIALISLIKVPPSWSENQPKFSPPNTITLRNRSQCVNSEKKKNIWSIISVQWLSRVQLFATPWIAARQASLPVHHQLPEFTQTHVHRVSDAIQPSHPGFSSCPQSLPASESFQMSHLFAWGGQSTGVSALASFLPKKSQGWSPSEWTGWISL